MDGDYSGNANTIPINNNHISNSKSINIEFSRNAPTENISKTNKLNAAKKEIEGLKAQI